MAGPSLLGDFPEPDLFLHPIKKTNPERPGGPTTVRWPALWRHEAVTHSSVMSEESSFCGVLRHTHTAEATAAAQFCCLWRHLARYSSTPPFLCAGRGNMSSAATGAHLALKTRVSLLKHGQLKPECSTHTWGPNRKWHQGQRREWAPWRSCEGRRTSLLEDQFMSIENVRIK